MLRAVCARAARGVSIRALDFLLLTGVALAAVLPAAASAADVSLAIRRSRLDNGLRVVLSRDTSLPSVAICVTYGVGARNEGAQQRGFAHLLEHLMFQGSRNVAAGEHVRWINEHGGHSAADTGDDRTRFCNLLPSRALALGLWLEADRMTGLDTSLDAFQRARHSLRAELARAERDPDARGTSALRGLVFRDYLPYARGPRSSPDDLGAARAGPLEPEPDALPALRAFHRQFYAPNAAVLSVAGDFELRDASNLIHTYFAAAPAVSLPPAPGGEPPEQTQPRSAVLEAPSGQSTVLWQGWAIPSRRAADHDALELAQLILGSGPSSRLHQLLVLDKGLARSVAVWTDGHRGPDLFALKATLAQGADPEQVRRAIQGQIAALGRFGPTAVELERAQQLLRSNLLLALDGNRARACALADTELFAHDARLLEADLERYGQISRQDVQRAVARYLRNESRSDVLLRPPRS